MNESPSYHGIKAISNTALSYINPQEGGCPEKYREFLDGTLENRETRNMITGTLVHQSILEPDLFTIIDTGHLSDTIKQIIFTVFEKNQQEVSGNDTLQVYEKDILDIAERLDYGQSWKKETRLNKIIEAGTFYFNQLVTAKGKTIVTSDVWARITRITSAIRSNLKMSELLIDIPETDETLSVFNELEIIWQYNGDPNLSCKSKIDRLILNHATKTFKIVDVKTISENLEAYPRIFYKRHTYRQLAFYEKAVLWFLRENGMEDYKPDIHVIVVAESMDYNRVRTFNVSEPYMQIGFREIAGLINRIEWHLQTHIWDTSMEDYENDFSDVLIPMN